MATPNYQALFASNGSGEAVRATVQAVRPINSSTITVNATTNWPTGPFIATTGTLQANGTLLSTTVQVFYGTASGTAITITSFAPGYTDKGNAINDVVVLKPATEWANVVANYINNATTGDVTIGGSLTVTGQSHTVSSSIASAATITPTAQVYNVTALAVGATIAVPSFTAADGMCMIIRIKDNGTAQSLSFAAGYSNVSGLSTPTATVAGKLLTIGAMYNSATSKWEIQGINQSA